MLIISNSPLIELSGDMHLILIFPSKGWCPLGNSEVCHVVFVNFADLNERASLWSIVTRAAYYLWKFFWNKTCWKMFENQSTKLILWKKQQICSKNDNSGFCSRTPRRDGWNWENGSVWFPWKIFVSAVLFWTKTGSEITMWNPLTSTIVIFYGFETWSKVWPFKVKVERKEKLACKSANKSDKKFAKLLRSLFKNSIDRLLFKRGHCRFSTALGSSLKVKLKFLTARLLFIGGHGFSARGDLKC